MSIGFLNFAIAKSRVTDLLKSGSDTVLTYESLEKETATGKVVEETYAIDVNLRSSPTGDDHYIMHFKNIQYNGNGVKNKASSDDLKAMEIPIVVYINEDFEYEHIMASRADTNKSLILKDQILNLITVDYSKVVAQLPRALKKKPMLTSKSKAVVESPLGNCKTTSKKSKVPDRYVLLTEFSRAQCTGAAEINIIDGQSFNDLARESGQTIEYYFNQQSLDFIGTKDVMSLKDSNDANHSYLYEQKINFKEQKPISTPITETSLNVSINLNKIQGIKIWHFNFFLFFFTETIYI